MYLLTVVRLSSGRNQNSLLQRQCFLVVVQLLSRVWFFVTPRTAACQTSLSFAISRSLLKLMSIKLMMPSNHLILCRPLLLLPSKCAAKYWLTPAWGSPGRSSLGGTLGRFLQTLASPLFLLRLWFQPADALCFILKSSVTWTSTIRADWKVSLCHQRQRVLGVAWS